jgi:hypothetical protein
VVRERGQRKKTDGRGSSQLLMTSTEDNDLLPLVGSGEEEVEKESTSAGRERKETHRMRIQRVEQLEGVVSNLRGRVEEPERDG